MLDFLRRKDKRKPAPVETFSPPAAQPLRDRNPQTRRTSSPSAASTSAQTNNHQRRATPQPTRPNAHPRQRIAADKENNVVVDQIDNTRHHRWGKRQPTNPGLSGATSNATNNNNLAATPASAISPKQITQPADTKRKRYRRLKKHEPSVLAKSVTSDRRRSIKANPATAAVVAAAAAAGTAPPKPTTQHVTQQKRSNPVVASKPAERRPEQPAATAIQLSSSAQPQQTNHQPQQPTWPHLDLATLLHRKEVSHAGIPVRRVAAAASRDNPTRIKMVNDGVAASLIALLHHAECTLDMRRDAVFALAELAVLDACEEALVAAGSLPALIWLMSRANNPDRPTLSSACRALRNLLGGKESTAILAAKYGCVEPLLATISVRQLRQDDRDDAVEAVAALSNLLQHGLRFQSYVIKHGGLTALSSLGTVTDNEEALYHIVNILAEIAKESRWHKLIVAADGLIIGLRALQVAKDPEVASEASRLIGNVAVTHKARSAVRDAGGLIALFDRLGACKDLKDVTPSFDIIRAITNICLDTRSAAEALSQKNGASILLGIFTAPEASDKLVKAAFRALQVLAQGSATRRAKVLYSVGIQVKQAAMAGLPVKRLYDLRQAILEDYEGNDRDAGMAMPESLERLSRASVRMINSGVVNHNRQNEQLVHNERSHAGQRSSKKPSRPYDKTNRANVDNSSRKQGIYPSDIGRLQPQELAHSANKFESTGRVVSVLHPAKPKPKPSQISQLAEGRIVEDGDCDELPRGNEEAKASDAELRARMLAREADGNMTQEFFEIGQVLGKGGYGSVFMAKDVRTGDIVAIKRFHNSGALVDKKAVKEQRIWKGLHHPNIVEFKGSFVGDNSSLNLVVEYVNGLSLAEHLSQYSAFPETLVAEIARQVLCGLEYLHRNGVTHRDLKPANILVDHTAAVKICDFGVSRSENVQTINPGQHHMVGTPWYIAPEMVEYRPYTTGVDIWSLGCTVLELATGRRPYHDLSAMQVLFRMVEDRRPPIPSQLSTEAQSFLKSCWVWDPQERPSASNLLQHPFVLKARKFSDSSKQSGGSSPSNSVEAFKL